MSMLFALLAAAGFLAGLINAVAGGGIMVVFPALLAAGVPPLLANATSNLASWPGALTSAFGYRHYLRRLPGTYYWLLLPCLIGAAVGAWLLGHTSPAGFRAGAPWLVGLAVGLFSLQPLLHVHLSRHLHSRRSGPPFSLALALLPMAVYGGYFGAGLGFVLLACLSLTSLHNIHQINGLKNLFSLTITLVCTVYFSFFHLIDWRLGLPMLLGSLAGGLAGSHLAQRVSTAFVHGAVILIGVLVTAVLFIK